MVQSSKQGREGIRITNAFRSYRTLHNHAAATCSASAASCFATCAANPKPYNQNPTLYAAALRSACAASCSATSAANCFSATTVLASASAVCASV